MQCDDRCYDMQEVCTLPEVGEHAVIGCPCRTCLVKMVCVDVCSPYADYICDVYAKYNKTIDKGELCKNMKSALSMELPEQEK